MVKWSVPDRGDIIWIDFDLQRGNERMKRLPALVLSTRAYNAVWGLCVLCPITSQPKGYVQEVPIDGLDKVSVVLCDQVKSFDWRTRNAAFIAKAPEALVAEVVEYVAALIGAP